MTTQTSMRLVFAVSVGAALVIASANVTGQSGNEAAVDRVFARWTVSTPGCSVGVAVRGETMLARAYGLADLEHDVRNTPETIFEAGSVSKQFTAAAVLLLARDGKLSLDDPVRRYVPELPDYGAPLTIRHMLNHTSGLRDWGSVEAIAGWPRTTREYTHAHVLDLVSRQQSLNFTPGTRWSYSNTGYNLAAVIVSRVSGMPFAEFTRVRIFEPLGMTHTSWRDDHTRIVKGRAIAYSEERDGFHTEMPFENVHGNGGLLTTVGDLLKWNENFVSPRVGDRAFVNEEVTVGRFNDGRAHNYALGLFIGTHKGVSDVNHSGATAGYRAFLARYPDQHTSVAVLCNAATATAEAYGRAVSDVYLGDSLKPSAPLKAAVNLSDSEVAAATGIFRSTLRGLPFRMVRENDNLRVEAGPVLVPVSATRFTTPGNDVWEVDGRGGARLTDAFGTSETFERAAPPKTTPQELAEFTGVYVSDEAETTMSVAVQGTSLVLRRRPGATIALTPVYADAFRGGQVGLVIFRRDPSGRPSAFSIVQDRVWDLRFTRSRDR